MIPRYIFFPSMSERLKNGLVVVPLQQAAAALVDVKLRELILCVPSLLRSQSSYWFKPAEHIPVWELCGTAQVLFVFTWAYSTVGKTKVR